MDELFGMIVSLIWRFFMTTRRISKLVDDRCGRSDVNIVFSSSEIYRCHRFDACIKFFETMVKL